MGDEEETHVQTFTAPKVEEDIRKGKATKCQIELWDKLLESRIRLQKSVNVCNCLPQGDKVSSFRQIGGSQVTELISSVKKNLVDLLGKLLQLQSETFQQYPETQNVLSGKHNKKKKEEDEEENEENAESEDTLKLPSKRKHTLTID